MRVVLVIAAFVGMFVSSAIGQISDSWKGECKTDKMTDVRSCSVSKFILGERGSIFVLSVSKIDGVYKLLVVGDGALKSTAIRVDKNKAITTERCGYKYCIVEIGQAGLDQLKAGNTLLIRVVAGGHSTVLDKEIPLTGFGDAVISSRI